MSLRLVLIAFGCLVCTPLLAQVEGVAAETDARIWGGLFYAGKKAEGEAKGQKVEGLGKEQLEDLRVRLASAFDGGDFQLLGEHTQGLFKQYESWLVPSRELFLKLDSKGPAEGGGVKLHLQLWREKQVIMKADTTLRPGSPLFIEGPEWRDGRLVFVVLLRSLAEG